MFKCQKCEALVSENTFLREQVKGLTDRLMALASPQAYGAFHTPIASDEFYGGETDEIITYNQFGEKVLIARKELEKNG